MTRIHEQFEPIFNHKKEQLVVVGLNVLSIFAMLISGAWPGYGAYISKINSNPSLAYILGIGFVGLGAVVSLTIGGLLFLQERSRHHVLLLNAGMLACLWMVGSPIFNAMAIAGPDAVKAEIAESLANLKMATAPVFSRYQVFRDKIVPESTGLLDILEDQVKIQGSKEMGGPAFVQGLFSGTLKRLGYSVDRLAEI